LGLGWLPVAPGTWGSLPPVVVFALCYLFGAPAVLTAGVMLFILVAGSVMCVKFAPASIAATGKDDPPEVVADELAGQALTFLTIPFALAAELAAGRTLAIAALGLLAFRIFDIAKPWPARKLEKLPQGWGVLADDLLAGIFAAAALHVCVWLWPGR